MRLLSMRLFNCAANSLPISAASTNRSAGMIPSSPCMSLLTADVNSSAYTKHLRAKLEPVLILRARIRLEKLLPKIE